MLKRYLPSEEFVKITTRKRPVAFGGQLSNFALSEQNCFKFSPFIVEINCSPRLDLAPSFHLIGKCRTNLRWYDSHFVNEEVYGMIS